MSAASTPTLSAHLAALDKRLHGAWTHRPAAHCRPGTEGSGLSKAALQEPACREPDDSWHYVQGVLHEDHDWADADTSGGAFSDVAPGTYYHERCRNCGKYRTVHSRQGQPDDCPQSYTEYYPWGTAPPAGELVDRSV